MKKFYFFLYQKKFLIIYIIIGFLSILFELFLRNIFIKLNSNNLIYNYLPLLFGILFEKLSIFTYGAKPTDDLSERANILALSIQPGKITLENSLVFFFK